MINIAIDGPAGAGKSTIAKAVAKDLGIIYLDTGAMYRATAYYAISQGIDVKDEEKVAKMLENLQMNIEYKDGAQQIIVNGVNATPYLREHYMSKAASDISALPCVRYKMVDLQRDFAKSTTLCLTAEISALSCCPRQTANSSLPPLPKRERKEGLTSLKPRAKKWISTRCCKT